MINVAPIRAAVAAAPGDMIALSKAQIAQLLDEAETGQQAKRQLKRLGAIEGIGSGAWRGYDAGIAAEPTGQKPQ